MKKLIFVFMLFFSFFKTEAQTPWIGQGATWHYTWSDPSSGSGGDHKIEYIADTLIQSHNCQVLQTTRYWYGMMGPGQPITLISTESWRDYTYNNGDTVFFFQNNKFDVLYNFGSQAGNKWNLGIDTNDFQCSKSIIIVDSTSSLQINSNNYRVLYTSDSTNSSVGISGKIIEHIGSMNYLFPTGRNCNPLFIVDFYTFSFSCFQDNTLSYSLHLGYRCEFPYDGASELSNDANKIQIFPNPTTDKLNIVFSDNAAYVISIYNILGQQMISATNKNKLSLSIDLNTIDKGVYHLFRHTYLQPVPKQ